MSIENSRRSIDGQWIRDNETKEFKYGYSKSKNEKTPYQKKLERLALIKIRNELMFKGMIEAQLRSFARDGITITREQLMQDIDKEVINQLAKQLLEFDSYSVDNLDTQQLEMDRLDDSSEETFASISSQTKVQIDSLKNNLRGIFGTDLTQESESINQSPMFPREPEIKTTSFSSIPENHFQQHVHTEQEQQKIREQMRQAQEQLAQTLEWAQRQSNETQITSIRSDVMEEAPEWIKDRGVSGYTELAMQEEKIESTGMHR